MCVSPHGDRGLLKAVRATFLATNPRSLFLPMAGPLLCLLHSPMPENRAENPRESLKVADTVNKGSSQATLSAYPAPYSHGRRQNASTFLCLRMADAVRFTQGPDLPLCDC